MRLGVKLTLYLTGVLICTMLVFSYLSIRADRVGVLKDLRLGMNGFSQAIQATLGEIYGDERNLAETRDFINRLAPRHNVHGLIVYDIWGEAVAISASLEGQTFPMLNPSETLDGGSDEDGYQESGGTLFYYRLAPIFDSAYETVGAFLLIREGTELTAYLAQRRNWIIGTTSALILMQVVLILFLVQRNVSRPIAQLITRIRQVGRTDGSTNVTILRENEIVALEREFNLMSQRLREMNSRLYHTEKLVRVGQLSAGLAHEIGTPLGIIGGRAETLLRRERSPVEMKENLEIIQSQIERIVGIVRRLLDLARPKQPSLSEVNLLEVLDNVKALVTHKIHEQSVEVSITSTTPRALVKGDPDQLQQVFINLFLNSLDALEMQGSITVRVEPSAEPLTEDRHDWVKITFEDTGKGIASQDLAQIFDPFFSTKAPGSGTGLGLYVANDIVKAHGGKIKVASDPGRFTRFTLYLPTVSSKLPRADEVTNEYDSREYT